MSGPLPPMSGNILAAKILQIIFPVLCLRDFFLKWHSGEAEMFYESSTEAVEHLIPIKDNCIPSLISQA